MTNIWLEYSATLQKYNEHCKINHTQHIQMRPKKKTTAIICEPVSKYRTLEGGLDEYIQRSTDLWAPVALVAQVVLQLRLCLD